MSKWGSIWSSLLIGAIAIFSLIWSLPSNRATTRAADPASNSPVLPSSPLLTQDDPAASDSWRSARAGETLPCTVERVVDGDTLICADAGRVRLLLIDTPEMDQGPFGEVAQVALMELLPEGIQVELETDVESLDQYDRLLAYLYLPNGRMVNEELLDMGVAVVAVYPPNVRHVDRFREIVEEARRERRGLWALGAFDCLPADYRGGRC